MDCKKSAIFAMQMEATDAPTTIYAASSSEKNPSFAVGKYLCGRYSNELFERKVLVSQKKKLQQSVTIISLFVIQ